MSSEAVAAVGRGRSQRRITFVRWVRKTHGWFGLWGALLGLMMGLSGIWLNHRAVLKLPISQQQINAQLELPDPQPRTIDAMADWLKDALHLDQRPSNTRVERPRPVAWTEKGSESRPLMQPERWIVSFGGPNRIIQVEYWVGNKSVGVRTMENGLIATLTNLHKGVTMPVAWILLIDTLAGSLMFLSVSGLVLWWETNRRHLVGLVIFGISVVTTVVIATGPLQW